MTSVELQLPTIFQTMQLMHYYAVGVGGMELPILDKYIEAAKSAGIKVVHVGPAKIPDVASFVTRKVGPVRVGIVSFGTVRPEDDNLQLTKRRDSAFKKARRKSDILVLLDQAGVVTKEWLEQNAKRLGAPDVVIGGQTWFSISQPEVIGGTQIMPTNLEARSVGVVKIRLARGGKPEITFTQTLLDSAFKEDADVSKMMEDLKEAERQQAIADNAKAQGMNSRVNQATPDTPGASTTTAGQYYDSATCASCHKSQHDSWKKSKHAAAVASLRKTKDDRPQCLPCHSEKFRTTGDYEQTEEYSVGVECASCHYRVLPHDAAGPVEDMAPRIDLDVCRTCHTKERSPKFEEQSGKYWEKAKHSRAKSG